MFSQRTVASSIQYSQKGWFPSIQGPCQFKVNVPSNRGERGRISDSNSVHSLGSAVRRRILSMACRRRGRCWFPACRSDRLARIGESDEKDQNGRDTLRQTLLGEKTPVESSGPPKRSTHFRDIHMKVLWLSGFWEVSETQPSVP